MNTETASVTGDTRARAGAGHLLAGAGGAVLILSLFLPWAGADGVNRSGWELWTMADLFLLFAGLVAIAAALTGGRVGFLRPDITLNGATDLLGVLATMLLAWVVFFDFPEGSAHEIGVVLALIAAVAIAGGAYLTIPDAEGEE